MAQPATRDKAVPLCFLLDDTAPVNLMVCHHPSYPHKLLIPNGMWEDLASFCREHGVRGKTSVLPCPSAIGRIDEGLWPLPEGHLERFLEIMREGLAPQIDITPELVTHYTVAREKGYGFLHEFEDEWVARQDRATLAGYLAFALRILKKAGLRANGMTSPWSTGDRNEAVYAAAISDALWRVNRGKHAWYFLHIDVTSPCVRPQVTYRDPGTGRTVVSIPSACDDFLWNSMYCRTKKEGVAVAREALEQVLSRDGKRGRFVELFRGGGPIVFHSHAQSLFSNGTQAGLQVFQEMVRRVESIFGDGVRWIRASDLAAEARA